MTRNEAILRAAAELFLEDGFAAVGVNDIGARAGISGPGIYRHFASKDEILATLFDQAMDHLLLLVGPPRDDDPRSVLDALIAAQVEFALTDHVLVSVYARESRSLSDPWRRQATRRQREHVERWVDAMAACFPHHDEALLLSCAHACIGMTLSVAQWPKEALTSPGLHETLTAMVHAAVSVLERVDD